MLVKPASKPVVLSWLNPPANGGLTIKQNKTKQKKVGFGSLNQNQNPPYLLVSQPYKQGSFSCFFSLRPCFSPPIRANGSRFFNRFSTGFQQSQEMGLSMPVKHQSRIETKVCPICGNPRPLDWFGQELKLVDYKKDGTVRKVVRYRKYHACWKCRAVEGASELAAPPLDEVME